uniref:Uncharacterized protein n=1 Tax=candidate division WOR-3 bacterium TaxID=2052148 RepID=A0A7V0Z461_UNCW3
MRPTEILKQEHKVIKVALDVLERLIYKEDNILYVMADAHLDESTEEDLIREFEKVEGRMGKGVHERYHQLVKDLKEKYLGGKSGQSHQ